MQAIGKVIEIWRYPVSSITGEQLASAESFERGLIGDRNFGLVEVETGIPARPEQDARWHRALDLKARSSADGLAEIQFPGGPWQSVITPGLSDELTRFFGFPVDLRPYENRNLLPGHPGPWAVGRYEPSALHLLTTASLDRLKALHPEGNTDRRRFRPNLLLEMPEIEGEFPETTWMDRKLVVGSVRMTVSRPTRRCGFTVIAQNGVPEDPQILRNIVRQNSRNLGVYCSFEQHGSFSVGDTVYFA